MKPTDKKSHSNWRPFDDARTFVRSLGFKNRADWLKWAKSNARPKDIPLNPERVYKNQGWIVLGDWLGTHRRKGGHRSFEEARAFARKLGLKSETEWRLWKKKNTLPEDIPATPYLVYKNKGWFSWGDWLGTDGCVSNELKIWYQ